MTLRTRQQETPDAAASFRFTGGMPGVSTVLYPGEKIRTARILLMPWDGEVEDSFNLSRRFLLKYHTPHVDGKPAVLPFSLRSATLRQGSSAVSIAVLSKSMACAAA